MNAKVRKRFAYVMERLMEEGRVTVPPLPDGFYMKRLEKGDLDGVIDVKPGRMFEVVKGGRPFEHIGSTTNHEVFRIHDSYRTIFPRKK